MTNLKAQIKEEIVKLLHGFELLKLDENIGFSQRRRCKLGVWRIVAKKL